MCRGFKSSVKKRGDFNLAFSPPISAGYEVAVPSDLNKLPTETIRGNAVDGFVLHLCLLPRVVNDGYIFV